MKTIIIFLQLFIALDAYSQISMNLIRIDTVPTEHLDKYIRTEFEIDKDSVFQKNVLSNLFGGKLSDNYYSKPLITSDTRFQDDKIFVCFDHQSGQYVTKIKRTSNHSITHQWYVNPWKIYEGIENYYFYSNGGLSFIKKDEILLAEDYLTIDYSNEVFQLLYSDDTILSNSFQKIYFSEKVIIGGTVNNKSWSFFTNDNKILYGTLDDKNTIIGQYDYKRNIIDATVDEDLKHIHLIDTFGVLCTIDIKNQEEIFSKKIDKDLYFRDLNIDICNSGNYLYIYLSDENNNYGNEFVFSTITKEIVKPNFYSNDSNQYHSSVKRFKFFPGTDILTWLSEDSLDSCYLNFYNLKTDKKYNINLLEELNKSFGETYIGFIDFSFKKDGTEVTLLSQDLIIYTYSVDFRK